MTMSSIDGWKFFLGTRRLTKAYVDQETKTIYLEMDLEDVKVMEFLGEKGLLTKGCKIAAIKALRDKYHVSVKEARDAVESIEFEWY